MAIDRKAQEHLEATRWRDAHEIQALRDMLGAYRRGATALAAEITTLRAETGRLHEALRADRRANGIRLLDVEIELDENAQDFVDAILVGELADLEKRTLEDALLVARELTAGSVRRSAATPQARAMLRMERSEASVRVAIETLDSDLDPQQLSIVERLSERCGTEQESGHTTVWAQLVPGPSG